MDSREKIRKYYQNKANNDINTRYSKNKNLDNQFEVKNKFIFKILTCIFVIIIFSIFTKIENSTFIEKVIDKTKHILEVNISKEQIDSAMTYIKNLGNNIKIVNGDENQIFIEEEILNQLNEENTEKK